MPQCSCFHGYDLVPLENDLYRLTLRMEGSADLARILERSGLAVPVSRTEELFEESFVLEGVSEELALRDFLDLLDSTIIVDIRGTIECYALGPYNVFDSDGNRSRTKVGDFIHRVKYWGAQPVTKGGVVLIEFIRRHPRLRRIKAVTSPPKADPKTPDLAGTWARQIAQQMGIAYVTATGTAGIIPQKTLAEGATEEDTVNRIANTMKAMRLANADDVLVVDDTIGSGGTLQEVARAFLAAGASEVFGLSLAKNARFTYGGIDLGAESWA